MSLHKAQGESEERGFAYIIKGGRLPSASVPVLKKPASSFDIASRFLLR